MLYACLWLHKKLSCPSGHGGGGGCGAADPAGAMLAQRAVTQDGASPTMSPAPVAGGGGSGGGGHGKKLMSEPLALTVSSIRAFSRELSRLGAVITFAYMCEHHPPFPHNKKVRMGRGDEDWGAGDYFLHKLYCSRRRLTEHPHPHSAVEGADRGVARG